MFRVFRNNIGASTAIIPVHVSASPLSARVKQPRALWSTRLTAAELPGRPYGPTLPLFQRLYAATLFRWLRRVETAVVWIDLRPHYFGEDTHGRPLEL
jgi:hypothetical protein